MTVVVRSPAERIRVVRLFGYNLETNFKFTTNLSPAREPADIDLKFHQARHPPLPRSRYADVPCYSRQNNRTRQYKQAPTYFVDSWRILRFDGIGDFFIRDNEIRLYTLPTSDRILVELRFLGPVMAAWMEQRGILTLHGSAIATKANTAVAFLAVNKGGKSTLAAVCMQAGCTLLSDDIVPMDLTGQQILARPGYPQMRMWPDLASHFTGSYRQFARVHETVEKRRIPVSRYGFGKFRDAPTPLAAIFVLEKMNEAKDAGKAVTIEPMAPAACLGSLLQHSFLMPLDTRSSVNPCRRRKLSLLAERIPFSRLRYRDGFSNLGKTAQQILNHVSHSSA